ncbi:hypothetical protein G443_004297 [Actinoalloteichus cyanogriseus DSM 43889]|uniref:Uncharacterized protein n=1 Tax=Actinoalloteichus caeruleus DSM 43889 TaxID=1120930 RepID=A0ABT1JNC0_ACTCY|nr:hypothetical protein [Actinoalloteichus caeruleus DSM 43889]
MNRQDREFHDVVVHGSRALPRTAYLLTGGDAPGCRGPAPGRPRPDVPEVAVRRRFPWGPRAGDAGQRHGQPLAPPLPTGVRETPWEDGGEHGPGPELVRPDEVTRAGHAAAPTAGGDRAPLLRGPDGRTDRHGPLGLQGHGHGARPRGHSPGCAPSRTRQGTTKARRAALSPTPPCPPGRTPPRPGRRRHPLAVGEPRRVLAPAGSDRTLPPGFGTGPGRGGWPEERRQLHRRQPDRASHEAEATASPVATALGEGRVGHDPGGPRYGHPAAGDLAGAHDLLRGAGGVTGVGSPLRGTCGRAGRKTSPAPPGAVAGTTPGGTVAVIGQRVLLPANGSSRARTR